MIFLLFGCASTVHVPDGIDTEKSTSHAYLLTETAHIEKNTEGEEERIYLINLDDEYLYRMGKDFEFPQQSYLAEGQHQIRVKYEFENRSAIGCLWLPAKVGERYVVKKELKEFSVVFWIENEQSGQEVGGVCKAGPNT